MMDWFFDNALPVFGLVLFFLFLVIFAVGLAYVPIGIKAEADCLRAGYPKAHVTYAFDVYCSTLDGAVTVKVDKQ